MKISERYDSNLQTMLESLSNFGLIAQTGGTGICQNLRIGGCLRFNFINLTAIGKLLVPGNIEILAFFTVHPKTITLICIRTVIPQN
jgi:hypothetical protein